MSFIASLYKTILDAVFPVSQAEAKLFSLSPEEAFEALPPAPAFDASVLPLPEARSVFAYKDERVAKLIWNIKYKKSAQAVKIGAYAIYKALESIEGRIIIIPMPITTRRRRERGFNQCELLADELGGRLIIEKGLLVRVQHASRQTLKGRSDRLEGAKGIFAVNGFALAVTSTAKYPLKDAVFVIIDDVITTGSTMREALDTLKSAGFGNVRGLSLAH